MLHHAQTTDAPVYLEDKSLFGISSEFQIPEIESTVIEHKSLGSLGVIGMPARGLKLLEGSIKLGFPEPSMAARMSNPNKALPFQVHQKLDVFNSFGLDEGNSTTLVTHVRAMFKKNAFSAVKSGEAVEDTGEFTTAYIMQRLIDDSTPLVEIDLFAQVYKIQGENVWPD